MLPFKKVDGAPKERHSSSQKDERQNTVPEIEGDQEAQLRPCSPTQSPTKAVLRPSPRPEYVDLPSFSQVDMSVFEALPRELREELEREYKRRPGSPQVAGGPTAAAPSGGLPCAPPQRRQPSRPLRQISHPLRQTSHPLRNATTIPKPGIFPQKPTLAKETNYKRITQQLAPRRGTSIYGNKSLLRALGLDKPKVRSVRVTEAELRDLNIDPEVFAMLPMKVQREQLVRARIIKKEGSVPDEPTQRKILKPAKPLVSPFRGRRRGPAPKAVYVQPPVLRQQGKEKGEKLCYFETDDIQSVIEKWLVGYKHWAPKEKDVEFFSKYLLQCVESKEGDMGLERAVAIMKWWLILLRRLWGAFENENVEMGRSDPNERAAIAWWRAFKEVKRRMDEAARKRFGGKLSLK